MAHTQQKFTQVSPPRPGAPEADSNTNDNVSWGSKPHALQLEGWPEAQVSMVVPLQISQKI